MHGTFLLFLGLLFPMWVRSDSRFRRPPGPGYVRDYKDNPVYVRGEYLNVGWDMQFKSAKLVLWQERDSTQKLDYVVLQDNTTTDSFKWEISDKGFVDPNLSHIYYFELVEEGKEMGTSWDVTSHYFNLTDPEPDPVPTNNITAAEPVKTEGLSVGASLGVGIGATLGVVLLVGVVAWLLIRRRRKQKSAAAAAQEQPYVQPVATGTSPPYQAGYVYDQHMASPMAPSEWKPQTPQLPSDHQVHEVQDNTGFTHEMHGDSMSPQGQIR